MSFLCAEGVISCETLVAQYSMIWQTEDRIRVTDQIESSGPYSALRRRSGDVLCIQKAGTVGHDIQLEIEFILLCTLLGPAMCLKCGEHN